jgi:hypothetical protein
MQNVTGLKYANVYIPITVRRVGDNTWKRELLITVYGIAVGEPGSSIDLYTSASVIHTDYNGGNASPSFLNVGLKVGGKDPHTYIVGSGASQLTDFTFHYAYNDGSNFQPITSSNFAISGGQNYNIIIKMKYQGRDIDQETIPFVKDGAPGIGIDADTYVISPKSTITIDSNNKYNGSTKFIISHNNEQVTELPNTQVLIARIGDTTVDCSYANGVFEAKLPETITVYTGTDQYGNKTFTTVPADFNFVPGETPAFTYVELKTQSNTVLASSVIPFVITGQKGDTGEQGPQGPQGEQGESGTTTIRIQPLEGVAMRFYMWDDIKNDADHIIYAGETAE